MHKTIDLVSEKGSLLKYGQKRKVLLVNVHSRVNMDEKIRLKSQFMTVMELNEHLMLDSDDTVIVCQIMHVLIFMTPNSHEINT